MFVYQVEVNPKLTATCGRSQEEISQAPLEFARRFDLIQHFCMPSRDRPPSSIRADQFFELADEQAGYFTQKQAAQLGYSRSLQHPYRQTGEWLHSAWGIYPLRRYPVTPDEDLVQLSLWSRDRHGQPQATLSHDTTLRLYVWLLPNSTSPCRRAFANARSLD